MKRGRTGRHITISAGGEPFHAFVPDPLPPDPPLEIDDELWELVDQALLALGRLDSVSTLLPDTSLFLYMYIRKEAVLSSQIEGTQSSLSDLLLFESDAAPGVPLDDVQEVSNYVAAMYHGLKRLRDGFPLSLRLIREIHSVLLSKGRGSGKDPGEFRRTQNWIGGTRPGTAAFVPAPADQMLECMGALEKFLHNDPVKTPLLIKAALAHVQFETIHPFLDGNGRLGRLLITFILCAEGALTEPMLYLSLYFKTRRQEYYELLQKVRTDGDWESWMRFFMTGVKETSDLAVQTANDLARLFDADRQKIQSVGRAAGSALRVHHALQQHPMISVNRASEQTGLSIPTATAALKALEKVGIARELTGRQRGRLFSYWQ
ncbi:MAG: Fic family protein, partial [Chloroflexota bacterium]|nr:Fic family protein [Chloroflexota bacterium]